MWEIREIVGIFALITRLIKCLLKLRIEKVDLHVSEIRINSTLIINNRINNYQQIFDNRSNAKNNKIHFALCK